MNRKFLYHLGNAFLILSLLGFVLIFLPFFSLFLFPPSIQSTLPDHGMFITIPKINAQSRVIENVDPWNPLIYKSALEHGVAHAKGTVLPGKKGTSFLFAHSSAMPWEIARTNTIFFRLGELISGDAIIITQDGKALRYRVREKKEVDSTEVQYLLQTKRTQLILQTCTPLGTSLRRLLVFADQENVSN
jgi:LPXTG-site transpeptidase (sortase) family protein